MPWRLGLALSLLLTSCAQQPPAFKPASPEEQVDRMTEIPLPGSGYIYDLAVAEGAVWVTSHAGLFRIDPVTSEVLNVLPHDYLFRVFTGYGDLWITTGLSDRSFDSILRRARWWPRSMSAQGQSRTWRCRRTPSG